MAAATLLMALVMGTRTAAGLFVSPLNTTTGVGLASLGFAMALGQLAQGFAAPGLGWLADRYGIRRLIVLGAWMLAAATMGLAVAGTVAGLAFTFIIIALASTAVGSSSMLLGEVGRRVSPERRAAAFAIISAGGSAGQLLIAPATQALIDHLGWIVALAATAVLALFALPLARAFPPLVERTSNPGCAEVAAPTSRVLRSARFWLSAGSFGVCGFHVAYLTTYMPGVIERCGLDSSLAGLWLAVMGAANIVGSLLVGVVLRRVPSHIVLMAIFGLRAAAIVALLALPATSATLLVFAVIMGLSYMALLPAISQQVAEQFGVARLATVFGLVSLVHQLGSFAGIWLGGVVAQHTESDALAWTVDVVLALSAVLMQLALWLIIRHRDLPTRALDLVRRMRAVLPSVRTAATAT